MALDIVISVAGKIAECLVDPIWRQIQYLLSYHENKENLTKDIVKIDRKRERVQRSVEVAKRNAKNIEQDVLEWLEGVEKVKQEANLIVADIENVQMTCLYCRCQNIKSRYSLSRKATKLSSEVQKLIEEGKFDGVGYHALERQTTRLLLQDFEKFESRRLTVKEVLETLRDSEVSKIGICGMAGVGKTKLVEEIAEKVKVEKSFDEVAIAVVSQTPDSIRIQRDLAAQLGLDISDIKDCTLEVARRLNQRLRNDDKRVLVILDDLWADLDLASLGIPVKDGRKGLKVMFTSRSKYVCGKMNAQGIIEVKVLNRTEAWLLFKEISGISDDDDDDDLKHTAEEVADECGGLPLAIVCIGGTLKNKKKHVWKHVLRQLRKSSVTTIEGKQNLVFSRIKLSYDILEDNHYRSLLLLCCLFPEDYEIPVEILVSYVKGLQMFDKVETLNETRDEVDTILDDLKACYLLLLTERKRHVKLHDVVRDVCLSIGTDGEHMFMSRHDELTKWPQIDSIKHFSAVSLTFREMNQLPIPPECPSLRLLRLLYRGDIWPNISMEGMKDLKVFDLNGFRIQSLLLLRCLTSLRTLCLGQCTLRTETSIIGSLKQLEVLSFYQSTVLGFPKEVAELTNLKLLDLRFKPCFSHPFPSGTFLGLTKLEELYMGHYWSKNEEEAKQSWIIEVNSLSNLTTLQMYTDGIDILRGLALEKMERFDIAVTRSWLHYEEYELQRRLRLFDIEATALSENSISLLLKKTEVLDLIRIQGLRNLVPALDKDGFNNLKWLMLEFSDDLEYIIDTTNIEYGLKNLESLQIRFSKNLKGLCFGSIQHPLLCNLKSVKVSDCNAMTSLVPQSISKCLMHLQILEIKDCEMLEEVISMEENTDDKVVELLELKSLMLKHLPKFKAFHFGSISQTLLNQVSLPALEDLSITDSNCPRQIVGCDMPNGSLHKLKYVFVQRCRSVACIAKSDSVKLLQKLEVFHLSDCEDMEVIFDLEGLKFTEGLVLLPRLESLQLSGLPKLASLWRMVPETIQAFQSLKILRVDRCKTLKYLFSRTPPLAKMLDSLVELYIWNCKSMEVIMGGEERQVTEEVADDSIKEIAFPKLRVLSLSNLEKLTNAFSSGEDYELIFPPLTSLEILKCPQLKRFLCGKPSSPRLKKVFVEDLILPRTKKSVCSCLNEVPRHS